MVDVHQNKSLEERNKTASDLMSELSSKLDEDDNKKKKRSSKSVFYKRCPNTGQRTYFTKRRPPISPTPTTTGRGSSSIQSRTNEKIESCNITGF